MHINALEDEFKSARAPNSDKAHEEIHEPLSFLVLSISGLRLVPMKDFT